MRQLPRIRETTATASFRTASLALALALAAPALASSEAGHPLAPFEHLVGGVWIGSFPDGQQTDEHRYSWVYGKTFLRDVHVVRKDGRAIYEGETLYGWDSEAEAIFFWYWASSGGVSQGTLVPEGEIWVARERHAGRPGEEAAEMRSTLDLRGEGSYEAATARLTDGVWKELWAITFERRGE